MIHIKNFISKINTEKKVTILIVSILLMFIILMNSTYSLLVQNNETKDMSYTTGILQITSEAINNSVTLTNSIPMTDADGSALVPYTFRITNTGNLNYEFDVKFLSTTPSNQIDAQYIKIKINDGEIKTLNNLSNGIVLENVTLAPNESILIDLRVWLSISTPNSQIGKQFSGKVTTEGYAVYTSLSEDILIENMPIPTGTYEVNTSSCTGGAFAYDYAKKTFQISNVTSSINCSPVVTEVTRKNLSLYIKDELTGTTQGNGQVVNENGYRYEGKNPNNYIMFNNELWRIIGVFDAASHGQTGQYLTKIIREDSIGGLAWDKNYKNNWPTSSLYSLLNGAYYNAEDGTDSGYCYKYSTSLPGKCDYRTNGIQDEYRTMVKNVTWYLGGYNYTNQTAASFYNFERSISSSHYTTGNSQNTIGYIGLMYISDFGYSVLSSSCARTTLLEDYDTVACTGSSWLKKETYEWFITQNVNNGGYIYTLGASNLVENSMTVRGNSVRPVLYLDSSVYYLSGTGSKIDPYIIAM